MTKTALITGASYGIGYELAKLFAADGYSLVLIARSGDKLKAIAQELQSKFSVSVKTIQKDLSHPASSEEVFQELQKSSIQIDALVNNAGFGAYGLFSEIDWERESEMMRLNIRTLTHLTKLFLDGMIQRKHGRILNVASTAAFQPGPLMAVYYATKAYVLSFSEALANELENTGVTVTCLCPGPTETEFQKTAKMGKNIIFSLDIMSAESVARIGYNALMKGKTLVIAGWINYLGMIASKFGPRKLVTRITRMLQESK